MSLLKVKAFGKAQRRERIDIDLEGCVAYAIGDIHGCLAQLTRLEELIRSDSARFPGRKLMILLGDYVDRGPDSSGVVSHLVTPPPPGFERVCLAGNHELLMLDYLDGRIQLETWLVLGGRSTLYSYGVDPDHVFRLFANPKDAGRHIRQSIPAAHIRFLRELPVLAASKHHIFVHAGLRPGIALEDQSDDDLTTVRDVFVRSPRFERRWIVHGHTRVASAQAADGRISIDTGVFETGRLTAVRLVGTKGKFIST
jgi:serine/threonine protein phosphatase 1